MGLGRRRTLPRLLGIGMDTYGDGMDPAVHLPAALAWLHHHGQRAHTLADGTLPIDRRNRFLSPSLPGQRSLLVALRIPEPLRQQLGLPARIGSDCTRILDPRHAFLLHSIARSLLHLPVAAQPVSGLAAQPNHSATAPAKHTPAEKHN